MKYLLFKEYESGFANTLMSLELAMGLTYFTRRRLVYYGSVGSQKQLKPLYGGRSNQVPPQRQAFINNQRVPTLVEILDPLPFPYLTYVQFREKTADQRLNSYQVKPRLVDLGFVATSTIYATLAKEFAAGRSLLKNPEEDILEIENCTLGYYSRFFYLPDPNLYQVMAGIKPQKVYRDLADKIQKKLGFFNGIHVRLTDFRKFLPQTGKDYPREILKNLQKFLPADELLVICTDESENKDFFQPILQVYQNSLFLDEFIGEYFSIEFQNLPFTDEVTFGVICNLVMRYSQQFAGTPGSTFTGMIHRNWYRRKIEESLQNKQLEFHYIDSGQPVEKVQLQRGVYPRKSTGNFSWNQIQLPLSTDAKSWYREWPESLYLEI